MSSLDVNSLCLILTVFRVNPIREAEENMPAEEMLKLLKKHVNNMHTSIKSAFLAFDEVSTGSKTRFETL